MLETGNLVRIGGMIGVQREAAAGAAVSVFGGGINPGAELPAGIDPDYILEFARAHEDSSFDMVLTGYSSSTPDGFEVAGYAAAHTKKLGYLIAHRPGIVMPSLAARKAATLDYAPKRQVYLLTGNDGELPDAFVDKRAGDGTVAYVCQGHVCSEPLTTMDAMLAAIAK